MGKKADPFRTVTFRLTFGFGAIVLQTTGLAPSGESITFQIPPATIPLSVMLQGASLTPTAANGVMALTDAHELRIRN